MRSMWLVFDMYGDNIGSMATNWVALEIGFWLWVGVVKEVKAYKI